MIFTYEKTDELYHHGILGQKWGVRRYQNPDGTLNDEGKKHKLNYETANLKARPVFNEGQKLINQNKNLAYDFGNSYRNVDDDDFFELVAESYGLDIKAFRDARNDYASFVNENYDSIKIGEKIIRDIIKKNDIMEVTNNGRKETE